MGLFDPVGLKVEEPEKWRPFYEFGGALLVGLRWDEPSALTVILSASKSGSHPALATLSPPARAALPADSLLSTVRIVCGGIRSIGWIGRPAVLADVREACGAYGRVEKFELSKHPVSEAELWADAPAPFYPATTPAELWCGKVIGHDYALSWVSATATMRDGA